MQSRREFIKKAALLTGSVGFSTVIPASIQRAMAINPAAGSTYLDAEHIVFLMQENRSFDHCFGTLQGVRGFNDPRAVSLPDNNLVWLQSNREGETFVPFRLNIKDSKATWMSSLPHSWTNQVDARNGGKFDKWLDSKRSGNKDFAKMPLTMGYYNREDIPFYYALADAFTVCDQHFCSSLTGTSPNRLYFWTGTIREEQHEDSKAHVWNGEIDYKDLKWTTFPERLEDKGISWKVYQNELSIPVGFEGEEEDWLANFTDNDLENFAQFNVRLHDKHRDYLKERSLKLPEEIRLLEEKLKSAAGDAKLSKELNSKKGTLQRVNASLQKWNAEAWNKLSDHQRSIHQKAFVTNRNDPDYHELTTITYEDNQVTREMKVPKGDVLHQFRTDVNTGKLPAVSWLVAPSNFSDHPGSPWYGAWYVSEVMDILTKNPEVWKKTIFILTYDENDGYFDHIPPFIPPHTGKPETGRVSAGIDTASEFVSMEQEEKRGYDPAERRESPIGLGYRVPMVVASPWSRGGFVNSQVFDHTSCLQFLEHFLGKKTNQKIVESNITEWRRTVCGNLSSVFRSYSGEKISTLPFVAKEPFLESLHKAKYKGLPDNFKALNPEQIKAVNNLGPSVMPVQEKGIRPSNALPYELYVNGHLSADKKSFELTFEAGNEFFGKQAAGAPFNVYAPGKYLTRAYAVAAGKQVQDPWRLSGFENGNYHLRVHGPNGFYREFKGNDQDPDISIFTTYEKNAGNLKTLSGNLELKIHNKGSKDYIVGLEPHAYHLKKQSIVLKPGERAVLKPDLKESFGWYDFSLKVQGCKNFEKRYAGRVETGKSSFSDPVMGRV